MSSKLTRREVLGHVARGAGLMVLGGSLVYLTKRAGAAGAWTIDPTKCVNIRLGATGIEACVLCSTDCVLQISAVKAVNEYAKCGRCCICPAYYDVTSETGPDGLPMGRRCPRDAIERNPIGEVDPHDPLNNFYEYVIKEEHCNGCGKCVLACKEPAGLGSIRLEVRHDLCTDCNRCSIAAVCPDDAIARKVLDNS
ncbi:MAG: ferredoxin [Planctomycetota bacterium]